MKKVILFGGSFDPIHNGHLAVAKNALEDLAADELWFVLAALSPFKTDSSSFEDRHKMLDLMIADAENLKVCTVENELEKPSYSIDTVKELKKRYPNNHYYWLIGSDQIDDLAKWKDFEILDQEVEFVVYPRPNYESQHKYKTISGTEYEVSSTEIRQGRSFATDKNILKYIMENNLYLESILRNNLSDYRYDHTLRVNDLALEIAKAHNLDEKKVHLIAMMHDYSKEMGDGTLKEIVKKYDENLLSSPKAFYHAYAAAYILKTIYYLDDEDVLDAIKHHVDGKSDKPYAMLLYIADKCEPGRKYDSSELINLAKKDLKEGYLKVKETQEKYLKENL